MEGGTYVKERRKKCEIKQIVRNMDQESESKVLERYTEGIQHEKGDK